MAAGEAGFRSRADEKLRGDGSWQFATIILGDRKIEDIFITDANCVVLMQELCKPFSTRDNQ